MPGTVGYVSDVRMLLPPSDLLESIYDGVLESDRSLISHNLNESNSYHLVGEEDDLDNLMQISDNATLTWYLKIPSIVPVSKALWKTQTYRSKEY